MFETGHGRLRPLCRCATMMPVSASNCSATSEIPIQSARDKDRFRSEELVNKLVALADRPWPEMPYSGKPLTQAQLAKLLKPFKVAPKQVRFPDVLTFKGYKLADFDNAFEIHPGRERRPCHLKVPKHRNKRRVRLKYAETNVSDWAKRKRRRRNKCFGKNGGKTANVSVFPQIRRGQAISLSLGSFEPDFDQPYETYGRRSARP